MIYERRTFYDRSQKERGSLAEYDNALRALAEDTCDIGFTLDDVLQDYYVLCQRSQEAITRIATKPTDTRHRSSCTARRSSPPKRLRGRRLHAQHKVIPADADGRSHLPKEEDNDYNALHTSESLQSDAQLQASVDVPANAEGLSLLPREEDVSLSPHPSRDISLLSSWDDSLPSLDCSTRLSSPLDSSTRHCQLARDDSLQSSPPPLPQDSPPLDSPSRDDLPPFVFTSQDISPSPPSSRDASLPSLDCSTRLSSLIDSSTRHSQPTRDDSLQSPPPAPSRNDSPSSQDDLLPSLDCSTRLCSPIDSSTQHGQLTRNDLLQSLPPLLSREDSPPLDSPSRDASPPSSSRDASPSPPPSSSNHSLSDRRSATPLLDRSLSPHPSRDTSLPSQPSWDDALRSSLPLSRGNWPSLNSPSRDDSQPLDSLLRNDSPPLNAPSRDDLPLPPSKLLVGRHCSSPPSLLDPTRHCSLSGLLDTFQHTPIFRPPPKLSFADCKTTTRCRRRRRGSTTWPPQSQDDSPPHDSRSRNDASTRDDVLPLPLLSSPSRDDSSPLDCSTHHRSPLQSNSLPLQLLWDDSLSLPPSPLDHSTRHCSTLDCSTRHRSPSWDDSLSSPPSRLLLRVRREPSMLKWEEKGVGYEEEQEEEEGRRPKLPQCYQSMLRPTDRAAPNLFLMRTPGSLSEEIPFLKLHQIYIYNDPLPSQYDTLSSPPSTLYDRSPMKSTTDRSAPMPSSDHAPLTNTPSSPITTHKPAYRDPDPTLDLTATPIVSVRRRRTS
uniref:Uncharacterized protein n=1 Tax=Plectus sambesii TaxID=2011161 RepID=A0A914V9B9_9BILA